MSLLETTATRTIEMAMVITTSENSAASWSFLVKLTRTFHNIENGRDMTIRVSDTRYKPYV